MLDHAIASHLYLSKHLVYTTIGSLRVRIFRNLKDHKLYIMSSGGGGGGG